MSDTKSNFFIPFMVGTTALGVHAAYELAVGGLAAEWLVVAFSAGAIIGYVSWLLLSSFLLGSSSTKATSRVWPIVAMTAASIGVTLYSLLSMEGSLLAVASATALFDGWLVYDFWYSKELESEAKLPVGHKSQADFIGKFPL